MFDFYYVDRCFIEQITILFKMSCTACFILSDSSAILQRIRDVRALSCKVNTSSNM